MQQKTKELLDLPMVGYDHEGRTIGECLKDLLHEVWIREESFSGNIRGVTVDGSMISSMLWPQVDWLSMTKEVDEILEGWNRDLPLFNVDRQAAHELISEAIWDLYHRPQEDDDVEEDD